MVLLSTLAEDEQVTELVKVLAAGPNGTVNSLHRALGLRALGGLLVGGIYNEKKLEEVRKDLSAGSKPQDRAAFEFFDVLLGKRNLPEIVRLQEVVNKQQDDIDRLNKLTHQQEEALTQAHQRAEQAEDWCHEFTKTAKQTIVGSRGEYGDGTVTFTRDTRHKRIPKFATHSLPRWHESHLSWNAH